MELNFSIETDDLYGENGNDFESLFTDSLQKQIIKNCKDGLASEKFNEFAKLTSDIIIAGIKLKMENFLSEEIALTEGWGKPTFVGSIEDLMKKRFDEVLLRPVDSSGKTLHGCTTSNNPNTWIEWMLDKQVKEKISGLIENAARVIEKAITKEVNDKIIKIKDDALKRQVDEAFTTILRKP